MTARDDGARAGNDGLTIPYPVCHGPENAKVSDVLEHLNET